MLELRGLTIHLGAVKIALELTLDAGEVVALIGPSGIGKSLVAKAIMGLLPPQARQSGTILWRGVPLVGRQLRAARGRQIAYLPQALGHLDPMVPVGQQLSWAAGRLGVTVDPVALAQRYGLRGDIWASHPHQISGGEARRVLLALTALADPDLIVADEPTVGLDPPVAQGVLRDLCGARAVLLISHDLPHVLPHADRVAILGPSGVVMAPAGDFTGGGEALPPLARRMWQALPQNGMICDA